MAVEKPPKVILFDLGGVCVASPFQAILDYELGLGIPPGWVNYSISKTAPDGFWHRLEMGLIPLDEDFFAGFSRDLHDLERWRLFYEAQRLKTPTLSGVLPPVPQLDAKRLFDSMMGAAAVPDPWMVPALKHLKTSESFIIAALSNTIIIPQGHVLHEPDSLFHSSNLLRGIFDVVVSSAHEGIRKPDPRAYRLALDKVNEFAKSNAGEIRVQRLLQGGSVIAAEDILFLDDIGENLREAKKFGFRTIKVALGGAYDAVRTLEKITRMDLIKECQEEAYELQKAKM